MNIFPDSGALGAAILQHVIGEFLTITLITAILTMFIWAIATAHGNHTTATKARTGLLVALGAAILAGAGVTWLNRLIHLGDQI